jgi:predicted dehydrogenase
MIKWLVAGVGQAGRCHISALQRTPDAALVGVVDPASPNINGTPVYADLHSALRATRADAVVIATPNDVQLDSAQLALHAGVPVLCEKPVGVSVGQAKELLELSEVLSVPVGVVLNQRAHRHCKWIKDLIDAGDLNPSAITFTGNIARLKGWHADPMRSGGGVLRTIGIHYIDLLMWWLGLLRNISLTMPGAPGEDTVSLIAEIGEGCRAEIHISATQEVSEGPVHCVIEGEGALIRMAGHVVEEVTGLPKPPDPEPFDEALTFGPGHLTAMTEATESLLNDRAFPVLLADAIPLLNTIQEMYEGARSV